jgi:creatinine amidohydrolase/Fe(II)-dependent formamide hydrolase-like protein
MEIIIAIVLLAAMVYVGYRVLNKEDEDGTHPLDGPTKAPYKVEPPTTTKPDGIGHESIPVMPTLTNVLDVNKDGKVDLEDAKAAAKKTKKIVKEVTDEVVEKIKKPRGRKPKAE